MTGSIKTFKYDISSDNSNNWRYFKADESNQENMVAPGGAYDNGGESVFDFTAADVGLIQLPLPKSKRDFKPRVAIYKSADGLRTKRILIPSQAMYDDLFNSNGANINVTMTDVVDGVSTSFLLARVEPQVVNVPQSFDTAIQDGDAT